VIKTKFQYSVTFFNELIKESTVLEATTINSITLPVYTQQTLNATFSSSKLWWYACSRILASTGISLVGSSSKVLLSPSYLWNTNVLTRKYDNDAFSILTGQTA